MAPGARVISVLSKESLLSKESAKIVDSDYVKLSGTSMATPFVSGAIALMLEKNKSITPNEVKLALKYSSQNLSYPQNYQGWGLLNIGKLLSQDIKNLSYQS